ncbi:MAG TPA: cobalamin-dependent protein [Deferrisomatales bacterium]|nr:cobalamin-dependent protein [Deferrisomatales bacterium]
MSEAPSGGMPGGPHDAAVERLIALVVDLQEEPCLAEVRALLAGGVAPAVLLEGCIEGMRRVGTRFEQGEYFIAALIMAGEIMREATELLSPRLDPGRSRPVTGTILLGTIQGDIHDLGKNLFALLLQSNGFEVVDLGVDVTPQTFLAEARRLRPHLVGISCVLTLGLEHLKAAVELLHTQLPEPCPPVIIGGACIDEQISRFVQADHWARDAAEGVRTCRRVIEERKSGL